MLIILFNSFAVKMESEEGISLTPSLVDFAALDVDDRGDYLKSTLIQK